MFDNLSDRLQGIFSGLRGKGRLTEDDINSGHARDSHGAARSRRQLQGGQGVRRASTKERCLDAEVLDSLSPAQNVIKIVLDELTELLGRTDSKLVL